MKTGWTKLAVLLLGLLLLATAASAENATTLTVFFQGLSMNASGAWTATSLDGSFDVYQGGAKVGQVTSTGEAMTLASAEDVTLYPASVPDGYLLDAAYDVHVNQGSMNTTTILAYADAGLFSFIGKANTAYLLMNAAGQQVMICETDEQGNFDAVQTVPSGYYYLCTEDSKTVAVFKVQAYRGAADQITNVTADQTPCLTLLGNQEGPSKVTVLLTGNAAEEMLIGLPSGWYVNGTEDVSVMHTAQRDYVVYQGKPMELDLLQITDQTDAAFYAMTAFGTDDAAAETVAQVLQGSVQATAGEVLQVSLLQQESIGITVSGTANPDETLLLFADDSSDCWLTVSDADGNFAFDHVLAQGETLMLRYLNDFERFGWLTVDTADAAEAVDMRIADPEEEATEEPEEEVTLAPVEEVTPTPTVIPTATPTATPIPTEAPTEIPQASTLKGNSSLSVTVFIDANNNGERGKYERLLAGTVVSVMYKMPGGYLSEAAQATTDDAGMVSFTDLPAGEYVLDVTLPGGYGFTKHGKTDKATSNMMEENSDCHATSETFTLAAGEEKNVGIGAKEMAALSGIVWLDANADGIMNNGEGGQAGVQIQLEGTKNGLLYETVSESDGFYSFPQVKPGVYKLRVLVPDGMGFTKYSETGRENRSVITAEGKSVGVKQYELKSGEVKTLQHIGLIQGATLQGVCFLDANYNGLLDEDEEALPGVKLELIKDTTGKSVATITTGDDGVFSFTGLRGGQYRLRAVVPEGTTYTCVVDGGNQFKARVGRREYTVDNIQVDDGATVDMIVGAIRPATITGTAYLDNNFSGTKDNKESVVSGIVLHLIDEDGNDVDTERTNAKGVYKFENVVPGRYRITATAKKGYAFTKTDGGSVLLNLSDGEGESDWFDVELGASLTGMDAGMILPGTVEGTVFADANDNGLMDAGETGLVGTVVRLMSEEGEQFSATIGEDGTFTFDAVMPGKYYLRYELPEHGIMAQVVKNGNTITGDNVGASDWFDFATGDEYHASLAGGLILGSINGQTFEDHDGTGEKTDSKASLSGVTLTLKPSRSDLETATIVTEADGSFTFDNLHPDSYQLTVLWPESMAMSRVSKLELPLQPGYGEQTIVVDIAMGDRYDDQMLGGVVPASLSGTAWLDEDNNGVRSTSEAAAAGIKITVVDETTGKTYATLTTKDDGSFALSGIIPGSYRVECPLVDGLIATKSGDSTFTESSGTLVQHVQLTEGGSKSDLSLGLVRLNSISGQVWVDQGGVYGALAEAVVSLTDVQGNAYGSVTTAEDGNYQFDGLLPGDYYVSVQLPEGYLVVEPTDTRLENNEHTSVVAQCSGRTGQSDVITVKMTETYQGMDIGSVLPGKLGDLCWLDENGNGLWDYDEKGLAGVKIELMRGDQVMQEVTSDQYGYWQMENVYPATYTLRVTPPAEVKPTKPNTAVPGLTSVLEETEDTVCLSSLVTVTSAKNNYQADMGFVLRTSGVYPEGFGEAATQDWTKTVLGE
ncbi:MAG: SdrD B-like domain-containing protein [Clostridia bacterium]|nr:SdrD B-like domain-containing protein [Clostridia bacterium]